MNDTFAILVNLSPYYVLEEGIAWIEALKGRAEHDGLTFYLALPFDVLNAIAVTPAPPFLVLGGQYMNPGGFTEGVASELLTSFGAKFVLLGTLKARKLEGESGEVIRDKIKKAQQGGLIPMLCVGETLEEFQQGRSKEALTRQIEEAGQEVAGLQVIYEAPWVQQAYSRPTLEEIDTAYQLCRELVRSHLGEDVKVYCPVPNDLKEVDAFIHTLHADGFYFSDPHQLTSIDETSLRAKAATARKAREASAALETAKIEPKPEPEEEITEEIKEEE